MTDARRGRAAISVRVRILAATVLVAAIGLAVAGATAYLIQREQVLTSIDARLADRLDLARAVVGLTTSPVEGEISESTATPSANAAPSATPTPSGPAPSAPSATATSAPGEESGAGSGAIAATPSATTPDSTRAALELIMGAVVPASFEGTMGVVDGRVVFVPGFEYELHLEREAALVDRITSETSDDRVRIGTYVGDGEVIRFLAVPVRVAGDPEEGVFVSGVDVTGELGLLDSAFRTYALVAFVALAALGVVGWFVAGRLLRPLRDVREAASRITAAESAERIPVRGDDDISELALTINDMLDRLDTSLTGQRQLLDDVRHELKTPLTIIRGHLELLDPSDAREVDAVRALAIDELDRMAELVDGIEALAEVRGAVIRSAPEELGALTREVAEKARGIPGHVWTLDAVAEGVAPLDRSRVTQAWLQLVDNAAKYSPAGSQIRIGSTLGPETVELWVADEGPGVPPGMEERIFERFGRAESGRGVRGSGLGLPIVAAIAGAHGGRVTLDTSPEGSRFALVLPAQSGDTTEDEEKRP